ncbi:MAG TPA: hypothetical protein VGJ87_17550 [Roseiflexaceae bacterium]|jgi:hypothetical protein
MTTASLAASARSVPARENVSWARLAWVAPLTVIVALAVNFGIRAVLQVVNPRLARMPQLDQPMINLTVIGCVAATVVFVLTVLLTKRPFFWYRIVAVIALLVSWLPDIALGLGGAPAGLAMRFVSPLATLGSPGPGGPPPGGGGPPGGGPPGGGFTTPIEQVLVLMLLHLVTAIVCVALLTTLSRARGTTEAVDGAAA